MVGAPTRGEYSGDVLAGDVKLTFDVNDNGVDLDFINIVNVDDADHTPNAISFAALNLEYDSTSRRIASALDGNESAISARFFGDERQEVAGIFNHANVMGSFGARR